MEIDDPHGPLQVVALTRGDRVLRRIREVLIILLLLATLSFAALAATTAGYLFSHLGGADPAPAVTGCPFGDNECGG